jgi:putative phosphoesterase
MRLAILSDIHGNDVALRNCLAYISKNEIDEIYFLGDAVGYLPNAPEVIDLIQEFKTKCIMGNHDAMALGLMELDDAKDKIYNIKTSMERLSSKQLKLMASWPESHKISVDGLELLLVHGSPLNPLTGYIYPNSDMGELVNIDADVIIMGHTHYPLYRELGKKIIINAGSVGLPRDVGNLSSMCIIETDPFSIQHVRIPFSENEILGTVKGPVHGDVVDCLARRADVFIGEITYYK